jgi:hypothetical protein
VSIAILLRRRRITRTRPEWRAIRLIEPAGSLERTPVGRHGCTRVNPRHAERGVLLVDAVVHGRGLPLQHQTTGMVGPLLPVRSHESRRALLEWLVMDPFDA